MSDIFFLFYCIIQVIKLHVHIKYTFANIAIFTIAFDKIISTQQYFYVRYLKIL